jgi:hypothetical protein
MKPLLLLLLALHLGLIPGEAGHDRLLFIGNSITLHAPAPDIGWNGNWGMAATSAARDYVHLVISGVETKTGKKPGAKVVNLADFERNYSTYDPALRLTAEVDFKAETLILAIGENVPALTTDEARANFQTSVVKLIKQLQGESRPDIYVRSCFWPDAAKDSALRQACTEVGGTFVDISILAKDEGNQARSERKIDHPGVAGHPGDKGMQAIATAILAALSSR